MSSPHGLRRNPIRGSVCILPTRLVLTVAFLLTAKCSTVSCFSPSSSSNLFRRARLDTISHDVTQRKNKFITLDGIQSRSCPLFGVSSKKNDAGNVNGRTEKKRMRKRSLPKRAVKIYTGYFSQLWTDTSTDARKRVAKDKATATIRRVQHLVQGEEYVDLHDGETEVARKKLLDACNELLDAMHVEEQIGDKSPKDTQTNSEVAVGEKGSASDPAGKKKGRSVLFGAVMGALVACWVFSGSYLFTGIFALMTILGQLEYYRMVMNTGIYPARRITVVGAVSMFLTALFAPNLHQICLPMFGLWAMIWFLSMRRQISTISEIATTFTGMFYLGYIPSFWVRVRLIGQGSEPTRLATLAAPILEKLGRKASSLPAFLPKVVHLPITTGAVFIFWTWLCLAFSDVGGYFFGRAFGKTKLGEIAPAAGATSPNKTVEGVIGGCTVSAMLGVFGAWVQKWPYWIFTGALHGVILGLLGLIGDLTASMIKRDAGIKDFGNLIPEHGGILDRVDSFVFTAPYSWIVCAYVIPALKNFSRASVALP
mmetsp:Transcript_18154/g.25183  ORF Transcript_18154/g.25183 Transcript_18154/m.25183 type:complete len:539 (-) Transcript_18154:209-1825(-)